MLTAEYVFEHSASAVVISKGVVPKGNEIAHINHLVLNRGLGMGAVFIHKLTKTDMSSTGVVYIFDCVLFYNSVMLSVSSYIFCCLMF